MVRDAKTFETNGSPVSVSRYVCISYRMNQLSTKTVMVLAYVTVMIVMATISRCIGLSTQLGVGCCIFSLVMDPEWPSAEMQAVQWLEADVAASVDRCSYPALRSTDN